MPRMIASVTAALLALTVGAGAAPAVADEDPDNPGADQHGLPGQAGDDVRLVVRLTDRVTFSDEVAAARTLGATPAIRLPQLDAYSVDVPTDEADAVRQDLAARDGVESVQVAHRRTLSAVPDDSGWSSQSTYMSAVSAPAAWDVTHGSASVQVAVIDTGVSTAHPDLTGKVLGTYNAVTGSTSVTDSVGHGTAVASVVAARTNNAAGIAGAGYDTSLLAVKVADANGGIWSDALADGIRWAADHGADVINMSLGGPQSDALERDAVAYARAKGVLVVASAGNDGTTAKSYPAAEAGVVSVGATTTSGTGRASFSTYGAWVDLAAPGVHIRGAQPGGTYATLDGTSFSSPLVAGEAALLIAERPAATEAQLTSALTTGTTGSALGFAHGLVDFRKALDAMPPTTVPTLTSPAPSVTVGGMLPVTATSTAPTVRFTIAGAAGSAVTAPVVGGTAHATLETYGSAGAATVTAADCSAAGVCASQKDTVGVAIANAAPVLTAPAEGASVGSVAFTARAVAPGGAVRFTVDGKTVATDAATPYSASVSTSSLANGTHSLGALQCNTAGSRCDTAHPAATRSVTVTRLHPAITAVSPSTFSPNGDGRRDTTRIGYRLDVRQKVLLRVRNRSGSTVFGPKTLGTALAAGSHAYVWKGRKNSGAYAGTGTYTVELTTSATVGGVALGGLATHGVKVDRTRPGLTRISDSPGTFYPRKDGYKDTTRLEVTISEPVVWLNARVYNSAGKKVRTISSGARSKAGAKYVTWNGRSGSGKIVSAGTYRYQFVAQDGAGNRTTSGSYAVNVSAKRLVQRTGTKVVSAYGSVKSTLIGYCSAVFREGVADWTGGLGYYSNYDCVGYGSDDLAAVEHGWKLPSALRYGSVRVDAYGRRAVSGFPDTASLLYEDKSGELTGKGRVLASAQGWHKGPTVRASNYLRSGRTMKWFTATIDGDWYDVKSYRVVWTYYVLR